MYTYSPMYICIPMCTYSYMYKYIHITSRQSINQTTEQSANQATNQVTSKSTNQDAGWRSERQQQKYVVRDGSLWYLSSVIVSQLGRLGGG